MNRHGKAKIECFSAKPVSKKQPLDAGSVSLMISSWGQNKPRLTWVAKGSSILSRWFLFVLYRGMLLITQLYRDYIHIFSHILFWNEIRWVGTCGCFACWPTGLCFGQAPIKPILGLFHPSKWNYFTLITAARHPRKLIYTNVEPKKSHIEKKNIIFTSTSMLGFNMLIFQAVYKTALLAGILQEVVKCKAHLIWVPGEISPQKMCSYFTLPGPYL